MDLISLISVLVSIIEHRTENWAKMDVRRQGRRERVMTDLHRLQGSRGPLETIIKGKEIDSRPMKPCLDAEFLPGHK